MAKLASLKSGKRLLDRQAADNIREHILTGVLPAGSRLIETQLAEELEVSRGTVRAALALLMREGLVQQVAFTRWEVSSTSARDAWELYTLRGALEALAVRLAIENVTPADIAQLRSIGEALDKAIAEERFDSIIDIDFELHGTIVALARHRRLAEQHSNLMQQVRFHMVHAGFLPSDYNALVREHEELIDAVVSRDTPRAERLARMHNEAEVEALARFLAPPSRDSQPQHAPIAKIADC
jgi:DNA-binding GntR family transcriptional regulator